LQKQEQLNIIGLVMNANGGCEHVKNRIKAACQKWKDLTGVLCDREMPIQLILRERYTRE